MFKIKSATMSLALCAAVAFSFACTKGRHVGGTDDNPAAVDTGGVPDLPKEGEEHQTTGEAGHEAIAASGAQTPAGPAKFDIGLNEYAIAIENQPAVAGVMKAGDFVFHVTNHGTMEHGLEIEGAGAENKLVLKPGDARDLSVNLKPGKYQFYCPVDGHKGKGMTLPLTVE